MIDWQDGQKCWFMQGDKLIEGEVNKSPTGKWSISYQDGFMKFGIDQHAWSDIFDHVFENKEDCINNHVARLRTVIDSLERQKEVVEV